MNKKIACLDADAIIKMSMGKLGFLEKVVEVFDKCYLHKCVYNEVEWPQETIKTLNSLINKNKIILITDDQIYDKLEFKELFFSSLQQACEIFGIDYAGVYSKNEKYIEDKDKLLTKIQKSDKEIEDNLGEIRTLQMIILFRDLEKENVNYFVSDDRRARRGIILSYGSTLKGQQIFGISLMSTFCLLKDIGMEKKEAMKFIVKFQSDSSKIYLKANNMDKISNKKIIDKLYRDELKLLKTGDLIIK